jgi:DNA-binding LytR/AlgR family response regulator
MRISVAIVEDNHECTDTLKKYLKKYSRDYNIIIDLFTFQDGEDIVSFYESKYDIILMDIEMKHLDGMSAAKKIREFDKDVIIIFITNTPQFAIKGYEVKALSYLLKPVPYFAFQQEINNAMSEIKKTKESFILITTDNGIVKLNIFDIYYVETMKHYLLVHTKSGEYRTKLSMKKMEDNLKDGSFFRCNSCYLINLDEVTGVSGDFAMIKKIELKISRPRKKEFMEALTANFGGRK